MSVPVLSWSFYAGSNRRRHRLAPASAVDSPARGARRRGRGHAPKRAVTAPASTAPASRGHSPPDPQSQSFSRSYGSILPTSLNYILLWTRGYTPWRPDAVMSTPGGANTLPGARIFKGRRQRTGHTESPCAFPAFPPPLRVNRFRGLECNRC